MIVMTGSSSLCVTVSSITFEPDQPYDRLRHRMMMMMMMGVVVVVVVIVVIVVVGGKGNGYSPFRSHGRPDDSLPCRRRCQRHSSDCYSSYSSIGGDAVSLSSSTLPSDGRGRTTRMTLETTRDEFEATIPRHRQRWTVQVDVVVKGANTPLWSPL